MLFSGKRFFGKLVYVLQALVLVSLVFMEYLSGYKGGLMKHLDYRKMEYMSFWFTPSTIVIHTFALLALSACTVVWVNRGERCNYTIRCVCRELLYGTALLFAFYNPVVQNLLVYPYLLMVLEGFFVFEATKVIASKVVALQKVKIANAQGNAVAN